MTDPAEPSTAAAGPWAGGQPARDFGGPRAAVEQLTRLMVLATVGVILFALVEPVSQWALQPPEVSAAHRGLADTVRGHGWAIAPPDALGHPRRRHRGRAESLSPNGYIERNPETDEQQENAHEAAPGAGLVIARSEIQLRDRANDSGEPTTRVKKGALLRRISYVGEWSLVTKNGDGPIVFGWARTSELMLR